jgi:ribosomal protein S18 acetylase RimI-like enzyme
MALSLRDATSDDLPFLREMLYEAVYWRSILHNESPPFDEGLAAPGVRNELDEWDQRKGDTGVVAVLDSVPVGAAWYRFCSRSNAIRGYIDDATPVTVLAVARHYRRRGIGTVLLTGLIERACEQGIHRLSLMVSDDNHAYALYRKCGFTDYAKAEDARLMIRQP